MKQPLIAVAHLLKRFGDGMTVLVSVVSVVSRPPSPRPHETQTN